MPETTLPYSHSNAPALDDGGGSGRRVRVFLFELPWFTALVAQGTTVSFDYNKISTADWFQYGGRDA